MEILSLCNFDGPRWLLFGSNVAPLVYYSHLPIIATSFLLAIFVLIQDRFALANRVLFFTIISFSIWVFLDSIFWASNRSDMIMFVWSIILLIEPLVYIGSFYLLNVLVNKEDVSFGKKVSLALLYLPLILFVPTKFSLSAFDLSSCLAIEGPIALYYTYFVEAVMIISILCFAIHKLYKTKKGDGRKEIIYVSTGVLLFLFAFAWGNIIGSFTENWQLGQYGLFGMPIFAGFLAYSIVRFKTFNIKLLAAQALVTAIWALVASILFIRTIENVRIIIGITLVLIFALGIALVKSVRREVEQREKIEKLAKDLEGANTKLKELDQLKSEFLSLATHQIRSPLTSIKGYSSMLLEGDFGELPEKARGAVDTVMKSSESLISIVGEFLDISRIEQGRMVYNKEKFDLGALLLETTAEYKPNVDKAGLYVDTKDVEAKAVANKYTVFADKLKIKQVIGNLIDNAVKYTKEGGLTVGINEENGKIKIIVKDTGVGIDQSEIGKLFEKFSRTKDAQKTNVVGTGLGLYIAKKMMQSHDGDILIASEGLGKGTTFTIELPHAN